MGPEQQAARIEEGGDGRLAVTGALTFDTAGSLWSAGSQYFADSTDLILDLVGVSRCDSAGAAVVVEWIVAHRAKGGTVAVRGMPEQMRAILDASDLAPLVLGEGEG